MDQQLGSDGAAVDHRLQVARPEAPRQSCAPPMAGGRQARLPRRKRASAARSVAASGCGAARIRRTAGVVAVVVRQEVGRAARRLEAEAIDQEVCVGHPLDGLHLLGHGAAIREQSALDSQRWDLQPLLTVAGTCGVAMRGFC